MVRERYLQVVMDIIMSKKCVTRRYIVDQLVAKFNLSFKQAERAATETLESLIKRGLITRKGRGVYCWLG